MNRRSFLKNSIAGGAVLALPKWLQAGETSKEKPNIILILTDDLGWGDLSCYPQNPDFPDAKLRTPNIDSLAAEGVRCTQAYATCMVCAPSRAGLLAGRYQQRFGWYEFKETLVGMPKDQVMLQEYLKKQGYTTACIGKWHLGERLDTGPLARGFDRFFGFLGGQHDYFDPNLGDPIHGFSFDYDAYTYDQDKPVDKIEYYTDELTNRSLDFINEQAAKERPFFLYLPYSTPHPPMQSTWEKLMPYADSRNGRFNIRDIARAMIDSLDEGVGKILDRLMHLGIDRETIVIFTSDNGGADDRGEGQAIVQHNGGLRPRKGLYWEGGIRVPMIFRWPNAIPEGVTYEKPISHLDIFATIAAIVGDNPKPKELDGVDLIPFFNAKKTDSPHEILFWGQEEHVGRWAVRKGKWKLTRDYITPKTLYSKEYVMATELHDLEADPYENNDLADKYPEKVKELKALLETFFKTNAPTIATPEVMQKWQKDIEDRKEKLPNPDLLRRDGAPEHWL